MVSRSALQTLNLAIAVQIRPGLCRNKVCERRHLGYAAACGRRCAQQGRQSAARLAQSAERKALNLGVVGSEPHGVCSCLLCWILLPLLVRPFPKLHRKCCTALRKCVHWSLSTKVQVQQSSCGLVAMTSASHARSPVRSWQVYALWRVREN